MKVSLVHMKVRKRLEDNLESARKNLLRASGEAVFIGLPEYFSLPNPPECYRSAEEIVSKAYDKTIDFLQDISQEIPSCYIIGGTLIEEGKNGFFNTCTLWKDGKNVGRYRKRNLTQSEVKLGLERGEGSFILDMKLGRVGFLVCADIFSSKVVEQTASLKPEVIFLPVSASSTHPKVEGHPLSEKIASEKGMFINKIGNIRSNARGGRSAIIAPWGIVAEASESQTDLLITAELNMTKLREYRNKISKSPSNGL